MRYAAAEKLEIIRLVEQSSLSVRRTLAQLGIPRSTFYCWYDRYRARDAAGLEDRTPAPRRAWNKLPAAVTQAVLELALKEPELSPREVGRLVGRPAAVLRFALVFRWHREIVIGRDFRFRRPAFGRRSDSPVPVHVKNEPQRRAFLGPIWERTCRDGLRGGAD